MKISVITINYNNVEGLKRTLRSVDEQVFRDFEHIVVDGGSKDGSKELLFRSYCLNRQWVSESDGGIYDAMNKGTGMAKGDYLIYLNSGDELASAKSLEIIGSCNADADIVYGDMISMDGDSANRISYPASLDLGYMLAKGLPHPSTAIKRLLMKKVGGYKTRYRIISDWAFFMEALFIYGATSQYIPEPISVFEGGGVSSNGNLKAIISEQLDFMKKEFSSSVRDFLKTSAQVRKYLRSKPRYSRWIYKLGMYWSLY